MSVPLKAYLTDKIWYVGSNEWDTSIGGWGGTSTNNTMLAHTIVTGTEETGTQSATSCSAQENLGWWDENQNFHSGWSDASNGNAFLSVSNPPGAYWVNQPNWVRDYTPMGESSCY